MTDHSLTTKEIAGLPHLIVTGNVIDGLEFYGPFENAEAAMDYGNMDAHLPDVWWIAPLYAID